MPRNRLIAIVLVAVVAVGIGAYLAYDNVLRGDDVAPLALPSRRRADSRTDAAATSAEPAASASAGAAAGASADRGRSRPTGRSPGRGTSRNGSEAGYRVREQLANLPAESDAVGRTSDVTGIDHARRRRRRRPADGRDDHGRHHDDRVATRAAATTGCDPRASQTDQFPEATFTITAPVDIPAAALGGNADRRDPAAAT